MDKVHCRRTFFEALQADPEAVEQALKQIAALYKIEDQIREHNLSGERKRQHRLTHSKPKVDAFFEWIDRQFERQGLLPSSPFTQALGYARERRVGLEVFLEDPDVQMDTNHLERALRVIPWGVETGCSPGQSSAPNTSVSYRACSPPAACTRSTPTTTWSTFCSALANIGIACQ
jgi:hypothetical protein